MADGGKERELRALSLARLGELRARERVQRRDYDPQKAPSSLDARGADPYRVRAWSNGLVGVLRGARALVTLDENAKETSRQSLEFAPSALCVGQAESVYVASRWSSRIERFRRRQGVIERLPAFEHPAHVADLDCGPDSPLLYVLDELAPTLSVLDGAGRTKSERSLGAAGARLQRRGRYLLASSLFEHSLAIFELNGAGLPGAELARIRHDGPIWNFDALNVGEALLLGLSGVEDHPLVREHGEFEFIDSYFYLYELRSKAAEPAQLRRVLTQNVSELGLVVPKVVLLRQRQERLEAELVAAGSGAALRIEFASGIDEAPRFAARAVVPGASDGAFGSAGELMLANPLFDAFTVHAAEREDIAVVDAAVRPSERSRLGEALFFTTLMSPANSSEGPHSRFSCETCHFEGGADGRVHHTGRADVRVVTKPLFGLANNRPHFSRALDADLSSVSHNEFRVAGAGSGSEPWFELDRLRFPWLTQLISSQQALSPLELREALLTFLYEFAPPPNPRTVGRSSFSALESQGAAAFAERCASCHAPRLFSDVPESAAPPARWQELVFARNAPIVWARGDYERVGITPYVSEGGARIPSLRRLFLKRPYFTNGSAATLADVLRRFRSGTANVHQSAEGTALDSDEQRALLAFLELL